MVLWERRRQPGDDEEERNVGGHNLNVGVAGTGVDELVGQADQALAASPPPELFLIQSVHTPPGAAQVANAFSPSDGIRSPR